MQFNDITERRRAEEALRQSEERLRTVIESIDDCAIFTLDLEGRITSWNEGARRVEGYETEEVLGQPATMFYTPEDAAGGKPSRDMEQVLTTGRSANQSWRVRKDGSRFWANEIMRPLTDAGGRIVGVAKISRDLTERKAFEDALRHAHDSLEHRVGERTAEVQALLRRLVLVQEEERRRIARDIHDHLAQQMTALRMNIEALCSTSTVDSALVEQADRTKRMAVQLDRSIDVLMRQLTPAALDHLGLAAALHNLATGWGERSGVAVDFAVVGVGDVRLARDVEATLYRIAQEALHNVAEHAAASLVTVFLTRDNGHTVLQIEDNGRGFDARPDPEAHGKALGLASMRERASLVGGQLEIRSSPHQGTSIHVRVPQ